MDKSISKIILSSVLAIASIIIFLPFIVMVITSLKTTGEIIAPEFIFFPKKLMWSNYIDAMSRGNWSRYFFNSFFITILAVVVSLIINSMAGYAFARLRFKGRNVIFLIILIGLMVPPQVSMLPVFVILKNIPFAGGNNFLGQGGTGWLDQYMGLLAPYIAGSFGVFLFRQFFLNFPKALDDAARIDGLGKIGTFVRIYVPLSGPVFASLAVLKATHTWNEYTWPLIIIKSDHMKTVQLALALFREEFKVDWHFLMAAATLNVLPLVILFLFLQKYFVQGISTTGIKG